MTTSSARVAGYARERPLRCCRSARSDRAAPEPRPPPVRWRVVAPTSARPRRRRQSPLGLPAALLDRLRRTCRDRRPRRSLRPIRPRVRAAVLQTHRGTLARWPAGIGPRSPDPPPRRQRTLLTNAPGEPTSGISCVRDRVGRRDRRRDGVHPPERHPPAARRAPAALRATASRSACSPRSTPDSTERRALDRARRARRRGARLLRPRAPRACTPRPGCSTADSGFSTAYIGSSNLTHSAQVTGLEWNVRVVGGPQPRRDRQVRGGLRELLGERRLRAVRPGRVRSRADRAGRTTRARRDPQPDRAAPEPVPGAAARAARARRAQQGHHRNLLVAATGTGKTVMAARRLRRLRRQLPRARLLFVAHREEILDQSLATFRYALRDAVVRRAVGRRRAADAVRPRLRVDPEPERRRPRRARRRTTSTW